MRSCSGSSITASGGRRRFRSPARAILVNLQPCQATFRRASSSAASATSASSPPRRSTFVATLERDHGGRREQLLAERTARQHRLLAGELPDFLAETQEVRDGDWQVAEAPPDLQDRRVEITGPTDRKMVINALNSGAKVFMADFEDANSPTWSNLVEGQQNMIDAQERTIALDQGEKSYRLNDEVATLLVRPRGWHLPERHVLVDGEPMSGSLFDFGLYMFHSAQKAIERGSGPYFYLPKLESHEEARLWNDVFVDAQDALGIPRGTIRATVLIETILAAFEMEEILYELREHSAGLNAGRWDYIFSVIKKFRDRDDFVLPDRSAVTMTVPFMRAYTELLVKTCHKRGAFAMGGMAAFIPNRRDPEVTENALAKVHEDKSREADRRLRRHVGRPPRPRPDRDGGVRPGARRAAEPDLTAATGGVGHRRAAARSAGHSGRGDRGGHPPERLGRDPVPRRLAQRHRRGGDRQPDGGRRHRRDLALAALAVDAPRPRRPRPRASRSPTRRWRQLADLPRLQEARQVFEQVALADEFVDFLTLPAYELLEHGDRPSWRPRACHRFV